MRRTREHWAVVLLFALCATAFSPALSHENSGANAAQVEEQEPGVSDERILFGQSAAFSGPARELGQNMNLGIEAAFREVNRKGGVHGRRLELITLDDAYEPEAAIANTRKLIEEEQVFALIGAVGTPTSRSAVPITSQAGVPYIAPFTGAIFLRDNTESGVINLRASYYQETEEIVDRLSRDLGITRIGVMYQNDSFGRVGYRGVRLALERRKLDPVAIGVYPRNTTAIKAGLLDLQQGKPDAVVVIGAYQPVATLITWARHVGFNPVFATISFVGSNALARELGSNGRGVLVSQVVPFPGASNISIAVAYRRALAAYEPGAAPGFVSFEGYLAGRLAISALEGCGPDVKRNCLMESLNRAETIDMGGLRLEFGVDDNQGSDAVFLTVIGKDGRYHPIESLRDEMP